MKSIWMEEVGHCNVSSVSLSLANRMIQFLKTSLNNCLQTWRAYCRKIASSKFLMGEVNTKFKIWLTWVITKPTFERIEAGEFTLGDRELNPIQNQQQAYAAQAEANIASQPTEETQIFHKHLLVHAGPLKYNLWLKELKIVRRERQTVYLRTSGAFIAQRIENVHGSAIISALQAIFQDIKFFKCDY